jgi:hypothetical protein
MKANDIGLGEGMPCGVPQRREKRFGNGVKNLSGSVDISEWLVTEMRWLRGGKD